MIVVASSDMRFRLVAIENEGWYLYAPPIDNPSSELFISVDDPLILQIAETLGLTPLHLTVSRRAAELILERIVNLIESEKESRRSLAFSAA